MNIGKALIRLSLSITVLGVLELIIATASYAAIETGDYGCMPALRVLSSCMLYAGIVVLVLYLLLAIIAFKSRVTQTD